LHIAFDFDGTLADSFALSVSVWNQMAAPRGLPVLDRAAGLRLRGLPGRVVLSELGVSWHQTPRLLAEAKRKMGARIGELMPFPHIADVLREMVAQGMSLHVVTSNSVANVDAFLTRHSMTVFESVQSSSSLWGKSRPLKQLHRRLGSGPMVYVGDEVRDIEAARAAAIPVIAVAWGYNTAGLLTRAGPDELVMEPAALLAAVTACFANR